MRKSFFIYTAISAAALLQSCEDKDVMPGGGIPAEIGSEVSFGAAMDLHSSADSRTVYGDEFRSESNLLKRAIWWRHAEIEGATDTVFIMCPEAAPGTQFGYFEVKPQGSKDDENLDRNVPAPVAKVYMDTTIRVGSENTHNFFGFYPSSAISRRCIEIDKNIVHATLPMNQISVFDATSTGNNKVAEPDMTNCHMVAFTSTVVSAGQPVSLTFQPAATVFDITVSGPPQASTTQTNSTYKVTSVLIRAGEDLSANPEYISGGYMFPFSGNIGNANFNTDHIADHHISPSNLVEVQLYTKGEDGTLTEGIDVARGQNLNLLAFTVPNKDVKQIEVEVYGSTTAGITKVWTKTLNTGGQTGTDGSLLSPGQIHKVTLGNLNDPGSNDYSSWMTDLPDDMLVTRMSIPGSDHAFSYNNNNNKYQDENIRAQFDAGVRAFRARIKLADGDDDHLPAGTGKKIMLTVTGEENVMQLGDAVHLMHQEIQARSDREFVVFVLSDVYNPDGSTFIPAEYRESSDYGDYGDYYELLYKTLAGSIKKMDDLGICVPQSKMMEAIQQGGGSMAIGPLRGRILLSVILNSEIGLAESMFSNEADNPYYYNQGSDDDNTRFCAINTGAGDVTDRKGYVGGAFAPWSSVERWLSKDKDSYMINSVSTDATTPVAQYPSGRGLDLWKHLEGLPALFTWYTRKSMTEAQIYPLVYGRMGSYDLAESPTKDIVYGYDNSLNAGDSESGVRLVNPIGDYVSGRKSYVTITSAGLAAMNASVVMDNAKTYYNQLNENQAENFDRQGPWIAQFAKADRSDYLSRQSYYSCPGIDISTLTAGGYSAFPAGTDTPNTFWCVYGEVSPVPLTSEFWTPTSLITDKIGYATRINTASWYTNGGIAQTYIGKKNVFVMTFLGTPATTFNSPTTYPINTVVNASRYVIGNFMGSATISGHPLISSDSNFRVAYFGIAHSSPMGIIFLPFIPNRSGIDTNNSWPIAYNTNGDQRYALYRQVRGIIKSLIYQTQIEAGLKTRYEAFPNTSGVEKPQTP